jgi:hypothetical protein
VSERDVAGLLFTAEMYGVQVDQLAVLLTVSEVRARALVARWRGQGYAESARLGPGRPWVWLTRDGLLACGLPYRPAHHGARGQRCAGAQPGACGQAPDLHPGG